MDGTNVHRRNSVDNGKKHGVAFACRLCDWWGDKYLGHCFQFADNGVVHSGRCPKCGAFNEGVSRVPEPKSLENLDGLSELDDGIS